MTLPEKGSKNWLIIFEAGFVLNFVLLLFSRSQLGAIVDWQPIIGFAIIALIAALIPCIGYFGFKLFTKMTIGANLVGLGYMLYITTTNKSDGWSDLTSIAFYISMILLGAVFGAIMQVIENLILNYLAKDKKRHKKYK